MQHFSAGQSEVLATKMSNAITYGTNEEFDDFFATLVHPGEICTTIDTNGETPLHIAIQRYKTKPLEKILEQDININSRNNKGYTPLRYALIYGHLNVAKFFIKKGARVNEIVVRKTGKTLLHQMILINKPQCVRFLLENGASVNQCNESSMTPLHFAVITGNKTIVNTLLEYGAAMSQVNNVSQTALHIAIQTNKPEVAKLLINHGVNLSMRDKSGKTMLYAAVSAGNVEITKQILDQSLINIDSKEKLMGRTPLHRACAIGCFAVAKLLVDYGANIKQLTKSRKAPIHIASEVGNTEIVQLLVEKSVSVDKATVDRKTPLMLALEGAHLNLVMFLIQSKADINTQDLHGSTPLHYAAVKGLFPFVELLTKYGADINRTNNRMKTALHEAIINDFDNVAEFLIQKGADENCLDDIQMSPMDYKKLRKLRLTVKGTPAKKIQTMFNKWRFKKIQ